MTLMDMIYYVICFTVQPFGRTRHKFELNTHRYICFFYRYDNKSLGPENVRFWKKVHNTWTLFARIKWKRNCTFNYICLFIFPIKRHRRLSTEIIATSGITSPKGHKGVLWQSTFNFSSASVKMREPIELTSSTWFSNAALFMLKLFTSSFEVHVQGIKY